MADDLHDTLIRYEGAVSRCERVGDDSDEAVKALEDAREAMLGHLTESKGARTMKSLPSMGKFTAIGMRTPVTEGRALVVNTCADNDKCLIGNHSQWSWCNPTNRLFEAVHPEDENVTAVSIECLWQGTKIFKAGGTPDWETLNGDWRRGKGKKPIGSWAGEGVALHTTPGDSRRAIYIPAFIRQVYRILMLGTGAEALLRFAGRHEGNVYLRDWDTGRGLEQRGPMSHAWVLASILNTGEVPEAHLTGELREQAHAIHFMAQRG